MLIRLEHNGRIIHELADAAISDEVVIGRSHACTWAVPKEDVVTSSRHAALFRKGKAVWLKDLGSSNGTFHNGKRIEKRKLAVGDKIGIGNCLLIVESDRNIAGKTPSELVILSGKTRGQKKPLTPPVFTIGSDPSASLVFLDMLISRRHAEIAVKEDGSCWIRDLGSKNGTSVNGAPLRDDKERLLKDGDRISCSHVDLEFHDGAVNHSNKQTWLKIGILAATLLIAVTLYAMYQRMRSPAVDFIRETRRLAASEAFDPALEMLNKAIGARGAAANQVTVEELRRLIGLWKNTVALWSSAQQALAQGRWTQASRDLGMLQASRTEAWQWNDQASAEKDAVLNAKALLDGLQQAEALIGREDIGFETLDANHIAVNKALAQVDPEATPAYLGRLIADLNAMRTRQMALLAEFKTLETSLAGLRDPAPPYTEIVQVLAQARASKEGALSRRAMALERPVSELAACAVRLGDAVQHVHALELQRALDVAIQLPSVDACTIDPRVSHARQSLDKAITRLRAQTSQAAFLLNEAAKGLERQPDPAADLRALLEPATRDPLLTCDTLNTPLPKRSRKDPAGTYDRILGVESFYGYVSVLPDLPDPSLIADLPFIPVLEQTRSLLVRIESLSDFLRRPDNADLVDGKLKVELLRMKAFLVARDVVVTQFVNDAEAAAGRHAVILGGMAARLATAGKGQIQIKGTPIEEWLQRELKAMRDNLLRLNNEYSMAAPTRQIEIRNEILAAGLPGDPVVRRMWAIRDAAGTAN